MNWNNLAGKSVYQMKEDFKDPIRDQKLAQAMRNKVVGDIRITPKEASEYFNKIPADSLPLYESEVEISPDCNFPKASRDAEEYCVEQIKRIQTTNRNWQKGFCAIANNYTAGPGSKDKCGQYEINRSQKTWIPPGCQSILIKEGQISNPF